MGYTHQTRMAKTRVNLYMCIWFVAALTNHWHISNTTMQLQTITPSVPLSKSGTDCGPNYRYGCTNTGQPHTCAHARWAWLQTSYKWLLQITDGSKHFKNKHYFNQNGRVLTSKLSPITCEYTWVAEKGLYSLPQSAPEVALQECTFYVEQWFSSQDVNRNW